MEFMQIILCNWESCDAGQATLSSVVMSEGSRTVLQLRKGKIQASKEKQKHYTL